MKGISLFDVEELASVVLGITDAQRDDDDDFVENAIYEKFGISLDQFGYVVETLIPYTIPAQSALSNKAYQGFVDGNAFIVKVEL